LQWIVFFYRLPVFTTHEDAFFLLFPLAMAVGQMDAKKRSNTAKLVANVGSANLVIAYIA
jgi:hypothetical protein